MLCMTHCTGAMMWEVVHWAMRGLAGSCGCCCWGGDGVREVRLLTGGMPEEDCGCWRRFVDPRFEMDWPPVRPMPLRTGSRNEFARPVWERKECLSSPRKSSTACLCAGAQQLLRTWLKGEEQE